MWRAIRRVHRRHDRQSHADLRGSEAQAASFEAPPLKGAKRRDLPFATTSVYPSVRELREDLWSVGALRTIPGVVSAGSRHILADG